LFFALGIASPAVATFLNWKKKSLKIHKRNWLNYVYSWKRLNSIRERKKISLAKESVEYI
jgi:hypothetical protein